MRGATTRYIGNRARQSTERELIREVVLEVLSELGVADLPAPPSVCEELRPLEYHEAYE